MQFTEKLGLPLLEGTDSVSNITSQGNGIANQLEEVLGVYLDDIADIPDIKTEQTEINGHLELLDGKVEVLEDMQTKETVSINGTDTVVTKHIAKISALMAGSSIGVNFKTIDDDNTHRHVLSKTNGTINIDLTTAFGITSAENIILKSAITYQNGYQYQSSRNALPTTVLMVGKLPYASNITLELVGEATSLYEQELQNQGGVEVWLPSYPAPYSNDQEVIVVLEFYTFN